MVLGHGGALEKLLPIFKTGLGGRIGNGKQWMSWIHINDLIAMIEFALNTESVSGIVNAVAPAPETNECFSKILAHTLGTKSWLPVPSFALKVSLGERAELLLSSQRVIPKAITKVGFKFQYLTLDAALKGLTN